MNKMNIYIALGILCLIGNVIFMFLASNEGNKKALLVTEDNLITKFSELDSVQKTEVLREIDITEAELKGFFEKLDRKSREKLFDLIKPEFESVKKEIIEGKDWELTEELKQGFLNQFSLWKMDKTKNQVIVLPLAGNDISHKMSIHIYKFLQKEGYEVKIGGTQLIYNGYGIKTDFENGKLVLFVGRKP